MADLTGQRVSKGLQSCILAILVSPANVYQKKLLFNLELENLRHNITCTNRTIQMDLCNIIKGALSAYCRGYFKYFNCRKTRKNAVNVCIYSKAVINFLFFVKMRTVF